VLSLLAHEGTERPVRSLQCVKAGRSKYVYMDRKAAKRWLVGGNVQGVGFRFFVQHKATALGLTGWARNVDDGRVEVYAVGPLSRLSDLAAALHVGPSMAEVRSVEEQEASLENTSGFTVR
jgi:acylphosphatase